jgi:hypothetical protein
MDELWRIKTALSELSDPRKEPAAVADILNREVGCVFGEDYDIVVHRGIKAIPDSLRFSERFGVVNENA